MNRREFLVGGALAIRVHDVRNGKVVFERTFA